MKQASLIRDEIFGVPSEDAEQVDFVQWLELQHLRFTAVPNGTYNPFKSQQAKNHRTGLRPGFPDLVVLVPPQRSKDGRGRLLAVEMKRIKKYSVSPEQREWIAALNGLGTDHIDAVVAHGADEAIEYVSGYLKQVQRVEF